MNAQAIPPDIDRAALVLCLDEMDRCKRHVQRMRHLHRQSIVVLVLAIVSTFVMFIALVVRWFALSTASAIGACVFIVIVFVTYYGEWLEIRRYDRHVRQLPQALRCMVAIQMMEEGAKDNEARAVT